MKHLLLAATVLAVAPLAAYAAPIQISLGGTNSGSTTISGLGNGNLSVSQTSMLGTATDPTQGITGTYTISAQGPATFTSVGNGVWAAPAGYVATLQYDSGPNHLTETLTYTSVNDGSLNPHFAGTDSVTAITGNAAFLADFGGVGRTSTFDYSLDAFTQSIDTIALGTTSQTQGISAGELVPNAVPEPTTLAILGVGVLGILYAARRQRRGTNLLAA